MGVPPPDHNSRSCTYNANSSSVPPKDFNTYLSDITLKVGNTFIEPSTTVTVKNLGVNLDSTMLMSDQVINLLIREFPPAQSYSGCTYTKTHVMLLITSRLDYAN